MCVRVGQAQRWGDAYTSRVGRVISAVLLAGGEDRVPVAIAGNLDDHGTGSLAVLHEDVLVLVSSETLTANGGAVTVALHPLSAIERAEVGANRSYYYGIDDYPPIFRPRGARLPRRPRDHIPGAHLLSHAVHRRCVRGGRAHSHPHAPSELSATRPVSRGLTPPGSRGSGTSSHRSRS